MSHPDPLFDPENVLPEDIDGEEVDRKYTEAKETESAYKCMRCGTETDSSKLAGDESYSLCDVCHDDMN